MNPRLKSALKRAWGALELNKYRLVPVNVLTVDKKKPAQSERRKVTEAAMIHAFETVLRRDGVRAVGVNSVVKEAGIGKGLIYKYFGGLPGLVGAWIKRTELWPNLDWVLNAQKTDDPRDQIKRIIRQHANALRGQPLALEILADELLSPSDLTEAFAEMRLELGKQHRTIFESDPAFSHPDNRALLILLYAAASYLAMRAHRSPHFMGFDLSTDEDWQKVASMFDRVIDGAGISREEATPDPEDRQAALQTPHER